MLTAPPRGSPPSQAHGVPVLLHGLPAEVLRWHPGGRPDHGRTNHREHGRSHRVESCRSVRPRRVLLLPSPPRPPLCSALLADTPFRPHSAPWPAEGLSACHPSPDALRAGLGLWGVQESPGCVAVRWRPPQCLMGAGLRKALTLSFMMEEYFPRPTFLRLNSSKTRRICGLQTSVPRKR